MNKLIYNVISSKGVLYSGERHLCEARIRVKGLVITMIDESNHAIYVKG